MNSNYLGKKIKKRRTELGLTQSNLSKSCDISVSYLNLIENNKRPVGAQLLKKLTHALNCDESYFLETADGIAASELSDISRDPLLLKLDLEEEGPYEIAANYPGWSKGISHIYNSYKAVKNTLDDFSDIFPGDMVPAESSHKMLSLITSIRSFSEILAEENLTDNDREVFSEKIAQESRKLGDITKALVDFLDISSTNTPSPFPMAEVEDFIIEHNNYFPEIEESVFELRKKVCSDISSVEGSLMTFIHEKLGIQISLSKEENIEYGGNPPKYHYHDASKHLTLSNMLPKRTVLFQLAKFLSEHAIKDTLEKITNTESLTSDEAKSLAFQALARYAAGAFLFPYDRFLEEAENKRYDIQLLEQIFSGSFEQICHRLVTLRKPGEEGVPFAFIRTDIAGNLSKRFSLPHFRLPRHGTACPIWVLYRSFKMSDTVCTQLTKMPDDQMFLMIAKTVTKNTSRYGFPDNLHSVMIACDTIYLDRIVYGDRYDINKSSAITEAGINCKLCPRTECIHRAYPLLHPLTKSFI